MDGPADRSPVLVTAFDSATRADVTALLRVCGYRVEEAETGFQTRARCRTGTVALAVVDGELPDMRLTDLLPLVRRDLGDAAPPVIVLTRNGWADQAVEAMTHGARDVICWPAPPVEVLARVESVLRSAAVYDSLRRRHQDLLRVLRAGCMSRPRTA